MRPAASVQSPHGIQMSFPWTTSIEYQTRLPRALWPNWPRAIYEHDHLAARSYIYCGYCLAE